MTRNVTPIDTRTDYVAADSLPANADSRYVVPALWRGLQLLRQFTRDSRELSGAELSRRFGLPRASVFRMLYTLEQGGFIERVGDGPNYRLGAAVLRLGFEYLASMELTEHGRPIIEQLRDQCGYSAHVVVRDDREVVFVARAPGPNTTFHTIQVGARLPAHATVLGRLLLGDLDRGQLEQLYSDPLPAFTPQTPTTVDALYQRIQEDRERGHGISEGGYEQGISTIAAPVLGAQGLPVAAVSITIPMPAVPDHERSRLIEHVRAAAAELGARISYESHPGPRPR